MRKASYALSVVVLGVLLALPGVVANAKQISTDKPLESIAAAPTWTFYDFYPKLVQCQSAGDSGKVIGLWNEYECRNVVIGYQLWYR